MDTYEKILVVFLASALAILLTLSIIVLVKIIKIVNRVNRISEKAEVAIGKFSDLSAVMQRFAAPMMLGKLFAKKFKDKRKAKRGTDA
jgi:type IV secretory pathway component VirB8